MESMDQIIKKFKKSSTINHINQYNNVISGSFILCIVSNNFVLSVLFEVIKYFLYNIFTTS